MAEEVWANLMADVDAGGKEDKMLCESNPSDMDFLEKLSSQKTGELSGPSLKSNLPPEQQSPQQL